MNDPFVTNITLISIVCISLLAVLIFGGFFAVVLVWYPRYRRKNIAALKETGQQGEATILWFQGPGPYGYSTRSAMYRRVNTKLEIRVPGLAPYQIAKVFTVPSEVVNRLEIGKVVPVWIDPAQPMNSAKIVIDIV